MKHEVAVWAGVSAFAGNAVALRVIDLINGGGMAIQYLGVFVASLFVGLAVYAKERLDDARKAKRDGDRRE